MKNQENESTRIYDSASSRAKGLGPDSAGQSGDNQGLPDAAEASSESIDQLVEEGQSFEAEFVDGVESAPDADVSEVHTRQFPEDDVPSEYINQD